MTRESFRDSPVRRLAAAGTAVIRLFSRRRHGGDGQVSNLIAVPATAKRLNSEIGK